MDAFTRTLQGRRAGVNNQDEQMVSIPTKQYAESIMAIQKLEDIRRIVRSSLANGNGVGLVQAVRAITEIKEGAQDG